MHATRRGPIEPTRDGVNGDAFKFSNVQVHNINLTSFKYYQVYVFSSEIPDDARYLEAYKLQSITFPPLPLF